MPLELTLEKCVDCGCVLLGTEHHFCTECEDEIRAEAAELDREPRRAWDIDGEAVEAFVEEVNSELNQTIHTARLLQSILKQFAGDHELPYVSFREDKRFAALWGDTAKQAKRADQSNRVDQSQEAKKG